MISDSQTLINPKTVNIDKQPYILIQGFTMRMMIFTLLSRQQQHFSSSLTSLSILSLLIGFTEIQLPQVQNVHGFQPHHHHHQHCQYSSIIRRKNIIMNEAENSADQTYIATPTLNNIERSTILLLEHVNLNIPHPDHAIQFYVNLLGCGYDPRRFMNVVAHNNNNDDDDSAMTKKKTIWANAGRSQFHLPYGSVGQSIMGKIGIRIRATAWSAFQHRVSIFESSSSESSSLERVEPMIQSVTRGTDRFQNEYIEITDQFQNVFYCRPTIASDAFIQQQQQQPIVTRHDPQYIELYGAKVLDQYITYESKNTDCLGIDFIEFHCPINTADQIATFYNACFDVPVQVVDQEDEDGSKKKMAIIAIGNIDLETGRTDQSLLFREVNDYEATKRSRYRQKNDNDDGDNLDYQYHIAIYVGETVADFQQAYRNCDLMDLIYINPRFSDRADTLKSATENYQQFRIQHIVDVTNGNVILDLEHEIRSVHHEAWIGKEVEKES